MAMQTWVPVSKLVDTVAQGGEEELSQLTYPKVPTEEPLTQTCDQSSLATQMRADWGVHWAKAWGAHERHESNDKNAKK
jgi:hypothetical protein